MEKNKLTRRDIEKILPPKDKGQAMEQTERYEREYEINRKELDEILNRIKKMLEGREIEEK